MKSIIGFFLALFLFGCSTPAILQETEGVMIAAAKQLLEGLSKEQRAKIQFKVNDESREIWHFLPATDFARFGLPLTELSDDQDRRVLDLVAASLSTEGFDKAQKIMSLEQVLRLLENNPTRRDPQKYHIAIYGDPSDEGIWSWAFSGHHLSLHYTMVDGLIASTPTFLGSNPAEVREGTKKGLRVLSDEEDLALELLNSLDDIQLNKAVILDKAPSDVYTSAKSHVSPLEKIGILFSELNDDQKERCKRLIEEYISIMPAKIGDKRRAKIENSGWDQIYFAWAGVTDRSDGHYYRLQGPSFLIEFDNTQNNANHVHSVWRDFDGDFGRDLIKAHYNSNH